MQTVLEQPGKLPRSALYRWPYNISPQSWIQLPWFGDFYDYVESILYLILLLLFLQFLSLYSCITMLAQSTPTSSDSFSTSSSSDFSPEIISQTPPTLQQQQPLARSGPGVTRRLSYKNATNLQQNFLAAHNQTPSIHPASSTRNAFGVQSQLCEILTEVKKTNERLSQYDGRLESMEQRLINLEQSTTSCSSDEFSQPLKRKVPPHVRVRRYLMKMFTIFYMYY